jgi:hypothetical protein
MLAVQVGDINWILGLSQLHLYRLKLLFDEVQVFQVCLLGDELLCWEDLSSFLHLLNEKVERQLITCEADLAFLSSFIMDCLQLPVDVGLRDKNLADDVSLIFEIDQALLK